MFSGKYSKIFASRETAREGPQIFYSIFLKAWSIILSFMYVIVYLIYFCIWLIEYRENFAVRIALFPDHGWVQLLFVEEILISLHLVYSFPCHFSENIAYFCWLKLVFFYGNVVYDFECGTVNNVFMQRKWSLQIVYYYISTKILKIPS